VIEIERVWRNLLLTNPSLQGWPLAQDFIQREFAAADEELLANAGVDGAPVSAVVGGIVRKVDALALLLVVCVTDRASAERCVGELDTLLNGGLEHCALLYGSMQLDRYISVDEWQAETKIQLTWMIRRRKRQAWDYAIESGGQQAGRRNDGVPHEAVPTRSAKPDFVIDAAPMGLSADDPNRSNIIARLREEVQARLAHGGISGADEPGTAKLSGGSSAGADAGPEVKGLDNVAADRRAMVDAYILISS